MHLNLGITEEMLFQLFGNAKTGIIQAAAAVTGLQNEACQNRRRIEYAAGGAL
ncbi:hypothetical protein D3C75_1211100 [compost metagenome]